MKWTREHASPDPVQLWQLLLEEGSGPDTLVLVTNLLMEREVRKKWQRDQGGFAPDIMTLTSFLEELAMHSLEDDDLPTLVPTPEERTLWLEQWLSSHGNPDFRRFAGVTSVTALSNIIAVLYRENQSPGLLLEKEVDQDQDMTRSGNVLASILRDYENQTARKRWIDREQLPGRITRMANEMVRYKKLVLYQVDEVEPVYHHALGLIEGPEMVYIRYKADSTAALPVDRIHLNAFHHPREELEQAARQILAFINDGSRQGAQVSRYDDVVILTGDLSLYEPMAASISERYGIPIHSSRGPSLISNPFVRRLLTYLKLGINDFPVDDVFRVFADNRLVLPDLQGHDENRAPNIRHFSQFCREYNFRTLEEAATGMDRVFDWLLEQIRYQEDEEKEERRRTQEQRNRDFYETVIEHLDALRSFYRTPERQTLTGWVEWTRKLLQLQGDLKSREANEAKELLDVILEKLVRAETRLKLGRKLEQREYFRLLELRLKETRERPLERPGAVLLTEIRHLAEVHDKIVFILGLHEDGFPRSDKPDFLQFRYEQALKDLTNKDGSEEYKLARLQFQRLLSSDRPRYLSRPNLVAQKPVMPSPMWLELLGERKEDAFPEWPVTAEKWLMGLHERGRFVGLLTQADAGYDVAGSGSVGSRAAGTGDSGAVFADSDTGGSGTGFNCSGAAAVPDADSGYDPEENITQQKLEYGASFKNENLRIIWSRIHQKNGGDGQSEQTDWRFWQLAAAVEKARQNPEWMGRYDGVIDREITSRWLEQQYGDDALRISISRLDTFARSPQEFFFKYVLRLEPLHEYQDDAESNIKGSLLHQILEEFYSGTPQEGPPVWPPSDPEGAKKRMELIRRRLIEVYRHQLGNPESPFPGLLKKNLERVTQWFLERETEGREDFLVELDDARPATFYPESGYSMEHQWSFEKELGGIPVLFRGKIDRIDVTSEGKRALIYDYKSGSSGTRSYESIRKGEGFQLPVYAMYMRESGAAEFLTGYYKLPINGKKKDVNCQFSLGSAELIDDGYLYKKGTRVRRRYKEQYKPQAEMDAFMQAIVRLRMAWIVQAICEGRFHASLTGDPPWSDFRHINRYDVRVQQKRWNCEMARRSKKGMTFELDRYYLAEPFWEDDNGG
ncbi:MAG: PD-(D/E)XK nuclease family protein [Cyclonatronaceae bacterium]